MGYVLVATTRGDELRGPESTAVAMSENKAALEALQSERASERRKYLELHQLPDYVLGSLISSEAVVEVLTLS